MPATETTKGNVTPMLISLEYMHNNPQFKMGDNYKLCPLCINYVSKSLKNCPGCRKLKKSMGDMGLAFPIGES